MHDAGFETEFMSRLLSLFDRLSFNNWGVAPHKSLRTPFEDKVKITKPGNG
jgi:hypothetical protein